MLMDDGFTKDFDTVPQTMKDSCTAQSDYLLTGVYYIDQ